MKKISAGLVIVCAFGVVIIIAIALSSMRPGSIVLNPDPSQPSNASSTNPSNLPVLADHMPAFTGITNWWNTSNNQPLTSDDLKGKVVLIDFWTYSCINCIRTQPVLREWWKTYQQDGLVIVGVHTPEFAFEKEPTNVDEAIRRAGLTFPIALDPDYKTWNAYQNHYWPAEYFFDRQGRLRHTHFGEGSYEESEEVIRALLAEDGAVTATGTQTGEAPRFDQIRTPETYFGLERQEGFANSSEIERDESHVYTLQNLDEHIWTIGGNWKLTDEFADGLDSSSVFQMNFDANAAHLVLGSSSGPKRLRVFIDGKNPTDEQLTDDTKRQADGTVVVTVTDKRLYRMIGFPQGGQHILELHQLDGAVQYYAATFGQ